MSISSRRAKRSTQKRNPIWHPFSSTSPWNLPVVDGTVTYDVPTLRTTYPWINFNDYSNNLYVGTMADPLVTCVDVAHPWLPSISWRIPVSAQPAAGTDAHLAITSPDGKSHLQLFGTKWVTDHYESQRMLMTSLTNDGIGPNGGVKAYGGSAIAGLIREWEVDPTNPRYTGRIDHAVGIAIDAGTQLQRNMSAWNGNWGYYIDNSVTNPTEQPGWNPGRNRNSFMQETGYVWPATEQDYNSMSDGWYGGDIPMGAYFIIPSSVDLATMSLSTPQGMMLAKACQDYGVYITDATNGATAFAVEYIAATHAKAQPWVDAVLNGFGQSDCTKIIGALRRVATNDENNPNGGPLNAPRRKPLAKPLQG